MCVCLKLNKKENLTFKGKYFPFSRLNVIKRMRAFEIGTGSGIRRRQNPITEVIRVAANIAPAVNIVLDVSGEREMNWP